MYFKSITKKKFCHSLRRIKVGISYGNLRLFRISWDDLILDIGLFNQVKELSKSNRTWVGVFPVYLDSITKKVFAIACLGKSWVFIRKFANFANKEI